MDDNWGCLHFRNPPYTRKAVGIGIWPAPGIYEGRRRQEFTEIRPLKDAEKRSIQRYSCGKNPKKMWLQSANNFVVENGCGSKWKTINGTTDGNV